jgi:hypothetical protein
MTESREFGLGAYLVRAHGSYLPRYDQAYVNKIGSLSLLSKYRLQGGKTIRSHSNGCECPNSFFPLA